MSPAPLAAAKATVASKSLLACPSRIFATTVDKTAPMSVIFDTSPWRANISGATACADTGLDATAKPLASDALTKPRRDHAVAHQVRQVHLAQRWGIENRLA